MAESSWRGVPALTTYSCSSGPLVAVSGAEPRARYAALNDGAKVTEAVSGGGPRLLTFAGDPPAFVVRVSTAEPRTAAWSSSNPLTSANARACIPQALVQRGLGKSKIPTSVRAPPDLCAAATDALQELTRLERKGHPRPSQQGVTM